MEEQRADDDAAVRPAAGESLGSSAPPFPAPEAITMHAATAPAASVDPASGRPHARSTRRRPRSIGALLTTLPRLVLVLLLAMAAFFSGYAIVNLPVDAMTGETPSVSAPAAALDPQIDAAAAWLVGNAERGERLLVDDVMADELVGAGWRNDDVIEYREVSGEGGGDDGAAFSAPTWWLDVDYVVTTDALGAHRGRSPEMRPAIENSLVVASFGAGAHAVEVRRVVPEGVAAASAAEQEASARRLTFGAQLVENPGIRMSHADRALVERGRVDQRIVVVLAALAAQGEVGVAAFPVVAGERDEPIRQVALSDLDGTALVYDGVMTLEARRLIDGLKGAYAPRELVVDATSVVLRYPVPIDSLPD